MGEHRYNPVARANSGPSQMVNALDLGEEAALIGVMLRPVVDTVTQELVIQLCMVGGHASPILGAFEPKPQPVGEIVRLPLHKVRAVLKTGAPPAVEPPVRDGPSEDSPPSDSAPAGGAPRLILGGRK